VFDDNKELFEEFINYIKNTEYKVNFNYDYLEELRKNHDDEEENKNKTKKQKVINDEKELAEKRKKIKEKNLKELCDQINQLDFGKKDITINDVTVSVSIKIDNENQKPEFEITKGNENKRLYDIKMSVDNDSKPDWLSSDNSGGKRRRSLKYRKRRFRKSKKKN